MSKIGLALLIVLGTAWAGCGDDPSLPAWPDSGGSDDDSDDPDVCQPETGANWGAKCAKYAPDCPPNTVCQTIEGLGSSYGICTTECCGQNDADLAAHCPNVAPGVEACAILDEVQEKWYCAVECEGSSDCPADQICQNPPNTNLDICYPVQAE